MLASLIPFVDLQCPAVVTNLVGITWSINCGLTKCVSLMVTNNWPTIVTFKCICVPIGGWPRDFAVWVKLEMFVHVPWDCSKMYVLVSGKGVGWKPSRFLLLLSSSIFTNYSGLLLLRAEDSKVHLWRIVANEFGVCDGVNHCGSLQPSVHSETADL